MAVVQISKIQIRRDNKGLTPDSDLPIRLSDGELAWCRDTKQLYIGSMLPGNPAQLENVEVLTEYSNIFSIGRYAYKGNNLFRSYQERLEDRVSANDFGILEGADNNNAARNDQILRDIIIKLYKGGIDARAVIEFGPGTYVFSDPISIPSFTNIKGSGKGRTIFKFIGYGTFFQFEPDPGVEGLDTQCRYVKISDFTIVINRPPTVPTNVYNDFLAAETIVFNVGKLRNSEFRDIEIIGPLIRNIAGGDPKNSTAFKLINDAGADIKTVNNTFNNIDIKDIRTGVTLLNDVYNNNFSHCNFYSVRVGFSFGETGTVGPVENSIKDCSFDEVERQAVKIFKGKGNILSNNKFLNVGNNFGGAINSQFGQVEFDVRGNVNLDDYSRRHEDLSKFGTGSNSAFRYVSSQTGFGYNANNLTHTVDINYNATPTDIIRFPVPVSSTAGIGPESMTIQIDYLYQSRTTSNDETTPDIILKTRRIRKGVMTIIVDLRSNTSTIPQINLIDDYEYIGFGQTNLSGITEEDEFLSFVAKEGNPILENRHIVIAYTHKVIPDTAQQQFEKGKLTYVYRVLS